MVAVALTALSAEDRYAVALLPDPGALTGYGIAAVRVITDIGAVLCIGSLLFAAFLVPPKTSGVLTIDGYAAVRTAMWSAVVWFAGALASIPFTIADALGRPVEDLDPSLVVEFTGALEQAKAWLITAGIALVIAVAARFVVSWGWTTTLFLLAVVGLLPVAVTGHSSSGGQHDLATNSLLYHLVAAALWGGGLVALLAHGRRRGDHVDLAARRFSMLALACWLTLAVSGVINALVRVRLDDLFDTPYGLLVLGKIAALAVLGAIGAYHRERSLREITTSGSASALVRMAAVEVLIMLGTIGLAVALSRTPPPQEVAAQLSNVELLIGYTLDGPPTFLRLLFDWRFDLVYGTAAIVAGVAYLLGVRRLRKRGDAWPVGRTIAWTLGCLTILIATSSGIGRYAPAMFSVHMTSHMLLSMLAPVLLVLGGPVTLALRALPAAGKDAPPGPREWLLAAVHSPVSRALTHPIVALALFVGSFFALYFSGLFDSALNYHWAHLAMNAHFLLAGYVFYWPVIGVDPAPRRLPHLARLGLVFASMPFHAFFGVILMSKQTVIGELFYRGLTLPWVPDLLADQRLGGGIAWASGEIPLLVVVITLLAQWIRADERDARRLDRREEVTGDADLEAYNEMLRKLAGPKK
ncbi:cytochrome c oxidase assembly protein [Herbihabitans rhizosphaerae]|nr:cytochrome c oxidase assembly protein [Herbihabitans rhizosphaerae]